MPPTLKRVVRACVYSLIREKRVVRARVWRPKKLEKTTLYEILKKSEKRFFDMFMICFLCFCEMLDIFELFELFHYFVVLCV